MTRDRGRLKLIIYMINRLTLQINYISHSILRNNFIELKRSFFADVEVEDKEDVTSGGAPFIIMSCCCIKSSE